MRNSGITRLSPYSVTADHALRATLLLAREPHGRPLQASAIADAIGAPRNYMAKTLNALAKAGVLLSARGPLGGFTLAVPAQQLTVARIMDVFATERAGRKCMLGRQTCSHARACAVHKRWSALLDAARAPFERTSVAVLLTSAI